MFGFLVKYAAVALLGTVTLWVGIPELKSRVAPAPAPALRPSAPPLTGRALDPQDPGPSAARTSGVRTPRTPPSEPSSSAPRAPRPEPFSRPAAAEVSFPTPPPEQPVHPASPAGPRYDWGVLTERANSYNRAGRLLERLPGGTVVETVSAHESSQGRLFRCRVLRNRKWLDGFFIAESAIVMFQGPYAEAPQADRDKVVRYFTLKGRIEDRRAELRERAIRGNPHFERYQAAARALTEHQASAKTLVEQRETATGMQRSRLDDQLRRLKSAEAGILQAFRRAETPYKQWRESNDDGSRAIVSDDELQQLERQLATLEPDVRTMVRGL